MTTVGVTGHRSLPDPAEWTWVGHAIGTALGELAPPLIGVSSLAEGADQCFADAVLSRGGQLHAIIPFAGFRDAIEFAPARERYDSLLARAAETEVLPPAETRERAYWSAGIRVVDASELLIAVWDGLPARGEGGTAEIVEHARAAGRPVVHVDTSSRTVHCA